MARRGYPDRVRGSVVDRGEADGIRCAELRLCATITSDRVRRRQRGARRVREWAICFSRGIC